MAAFSGPIDVPSPNTSSVTPWRIPLWERPSTSSASFAQLSMLMKPGATARPAASTSSAARAPGRSPTATIESPRMATSATTGSAPDPSYTCPLRIRTS